MCVCGGRGAMPLGDEGSCFIHQCHMSHTDKHRNCKLIIHNTHKTCHACPVSPQDLSICSPCLCTQAQHASRQNSEFVVQSVLSRSVAVKDQGRGKGNAMRAPPHTTPPTQYLCTHVMCGHLLKQSLEVVHVFC